jgi:hypothetical protein
LTSGFMGKLGGIIIFCKLLTVYSVQNKPNIHNCLFPNTLLHRSCFALVNLLGEGKRLTGAKQGRCKNRAVFVPHGCVSFSWICLYVLFYTISVCPVTIYSCPDFSRGACRSIGRRGNPCSRCAPGGYRVHLRRWSSPDLFCCGKRRNPDRAGRWNMHR